MRLLPAPTADDRSASRRLARDPNPLRESQLTPGPGPGTLPARAGRPPQEVPVNVRSSAIRPVRKKTLLPALSAIIGVLLLPGTLASASPATPPAPPLTPPPPTAPHPPTPL